MEETADHQVKLNDLQLVMLSTACNREDGGLLPTAIARAQRWRRRLLEEPDLTITDLVHIESLAPSYVIRTNVIPPGWHEQKQQLGFQTRRTAG